MGGAALKPDRARSDLAAGVTAFCVIAASLLLSFLLFHLGQVRAFLGTLAQILRPIFLGMVFAFLLLPIHRWIQVFLLSLTNTPKGSGGRMEKILDLAAIVASMALALFLLYLLLAMVIPQLYVSVVNLVNAFPGYIQSVQGWLRDYLKDNPEVEGSVMSLYDSAAASLQRWLSVEILPNLESVTSTVNWLKDSVLPNLTGVAAGVSGMVAGVSGLVVGLLVLVKDLFIALIVVVYLLVRKDVFAAQSKKIVYSIFPTRVGDLIVQETRNAYHIMSGFINGKLLDSLIIGLIALVCCNLLHFPYPALVATVIGVTNIIPFFGPFIGAIPCAFLILLVSPVQCLYFVIFILILQQFDGNILGPKILGDSTGLASFWVLFSILLFGGLFGFAGMVLGVPVFAMIYSALQRLVRRGLERHGLPEETEEYMGPTGPLAARAREAEQAEQEENLP